MPTSDQSSLSDAAPSASPAENAGRGESLRIATRESPLAMWQARHVAGLLSRLGVQSTLVPLVSGGDIDMRPIDGKRSVGVFTKRIQQALLDDEGDVAVHSMKDLPTESHRELFVAASPARETVVDCLVSESTFDLETLPRGAHVGTGSRRRAAQLLQKRPDLKVSPIRGNVQTRLRKLHDGEYDAIVLAAAGLERLEMSDVPRVALPLDMMLPAPGQGALAIEVRRDDEHAARWVAQIDHPITSACTTAERTLLNELHGGCLAPIAAHATVEEGTLKLVAKVLSVDGKQCLDAASQSALTDEHSGVSVARELGKQAAAELIDQGAAALIESGR
ncbi:MAG: hydroxymethylbilane synthase [Planctomycetota bacterium]